MDVAEGEWKTIQVAPLAPGFFEGVSPLVAVLLQQMVGDSTKTRVVAGLLGSDGGILPSRGTGINDMGSPWDPNFYKAK